MVREFRNEPRSTEQRFFENRVAIRVGETFAGLEAAGASSPECRANAAGSLEARLTGRQARSVNGTTIEGLAYSPGSSMPLPPLRQPNSYMVKLIGGAEKVAMALAGVVALVIATLWLTTSLPSRPPSWSGMTLNSALAIIVCVASLALSGARRSTAELRLSQAAAAAVTALGCMVLIEYATSSTFGFDTWLPHGPLCQ